MSNRQHAVNTAGTKKRTSAGDAFSGLAFRAIRLGALLNAIGDTLAEPAGQTSARWQVLAGAEHGPATVAQIARALGLARQSVQRVADLVVRDGLATSGENPDDRRADLLTLTTKGRGALTAIQEAQRVWADEHGARVGERDLARASEVLDRVLESLQTTSKDDT